MQQLAVNTLSSERDWTSGNQLQVDCKSTETNSGDGIHDVSCQKISEVTLETIIP